MYTTTVLLSFITVTYYRPLGALLIEVLFKLTIFKDIMTAFNVRKEFKTWNTVSCTTFVHHCHTYNTSKLFEICIKS